MITNGILLVFQGIINVLLSPLTVLNISIDFLSSIPYINDFLCVCAYLLPFNNLLPLIILVCSIFVFRITVSIIKLVLDFIPFI